MYSAKKLGGLGVAMALAGVSMTWTSCSKENMASPSDADVTEVQGGQKLLASYIFGYVGGSAPYSFNVHIGTDASAGSAVGGTNPNIPKLGANPPGGFATAGQTVQCSATTDATRCIFLFGTTYYLVPTQYVSTPKILRVTFNSMPPLSTSTPWFTYNKAANSWTYPVNVPWATATQVNSVNWVGC